DGIPRFETAEVMRISSSRRTRAVGIAGEAKRVFPNLRARGSVTGAFLRPIQMLFAHTGCYVAPYRPSLSERSSYEELMQKGDTPYGGRTVTVRNRRRVIRPEQRRREPTGRSSKE